MQGEERGKRAVIDANGEVHGSGSGAGGRGTPHEDYDPELKDGGDTKKARHPLPASGEARHGEIPERTEAEKGKGEDAAQVLQPASDAVTPEGEPYPR